MANWTTPITRKLNQTFKGQCPRIQAAVYGSFLSIRMDDPEGTVSLKLAQEIAIAAGKLFVEAGACKKSTPISLAYHFGGVVANWSIHE